MTRPNSPVCLAALLVLPFAAGCCSTFERDWNALASRPAPADSLAGLWEGTWESDHNGHNGALRAIITPCGPNRYFARYDARFCWFIPYGYDTNLDAVGDGSKTHFVAEADLGKLAGGVYRCAGWADGERYVASYQADKDHGRFTMCRVGCGRFVSADVGVPPFEAEPEPRAVSDPTPDSARPLPTPPGPTEVYDDRSTGTLEGVVPPRPPR